MLQKLYTFIIVWYYSLRRQSRLGKRRDLTAIKTLSCTCSLYKTDNTESGRGHGDVNVQVMLAWQIRIGVSINPRSVSAQHMQDALDALAAVDLLREEDLLLLGTAPQIWCSVVPSNYQCAPDALQGVVTAAPPAPAAVGPRLGLTNGAGALSAP